MAGVYPTAVKLMASWFKERRGFAIGILLGALTIGSGLPFIFNITGLPEWKVILLISSILAFTSASLVLGFIKEGPFGTKGGRFKATYLKEIFANISTRLEDFGYYGHMWELYAFWVWLPVFLRVAFLITFPVEDSTLFFSL